MAEREQPKQSIQEFISPDRLLPREQSQAFIDRTQELVNLMAQVIGVSPVKVKPPQLPTPNGDGPEIGFLKAPEGLSPEELKSLNGKLSSVYASEGVEFQDVHVEKTQTVESKERMVSLRAIFTQEEMVGKVQFSDARFNEACGLVNGEARLREFWVREEVSKRLVQVVKALNAINVGLKFEDGFRPLGVQEGLFVRRVKMILDAHTDWTYEQNFDQILIEARSKTGYTPIVSAHKGGAAVDATLYNLGEKNTRDLGNAYPAGEAQVALNFPFVTHEQWETRQLFSTAMQMVGLTPYLWEDWHASYGDNLAAGDTHHAIYGPIRGFDKKTGEIIPYDEAEYYEPFFKTPSDLKRAVDTYSKFLEERGKLK